MTLVGEYRAARRDEDVARLRRVLALRALVAAGMSQRQIAEALGISQPAVSQQLKFAPELQDVHPELLVEAAAPVLRTLLAEHGYDRLAIFGSVARRDARPDSDIDLTVEAPAGTSSFDFMAGIRLIMRCGAEKLTDRQRARLDRAVAADERHDEVWVAWSCAQRLRDAYRAENLVEGRRIAEQVLATFPTCPIPEIARLGRTLRQWSAAFLAYFDTGRSSNGGTEAVNGLIELHRRVAFAARPPQVNPQVNALPSTEPPTR